MGTESSADATIEVGAPRSADVSVAVEPGATLGHYELVSPLGQGGMGVVFRARDDRLDRDVAVKVLHPRAELDESRGRARLVREARALAAIRHPKVVEIYDVGTESGVVFFAMELIEGVTLAEWLETPRSPAEILGAFIAAGRGLAAAHTGGVIHRDFKASNVMIAVDAHPDLERDSGRIVVTDFGIAAA